MQVLVIGIGNPIRGDDRLGWVVADLLKSKHKDPNLCILQVQQLTLDLIEPLSKVDQVIFIDARVGNSPGLIEKAKIEANTALNSPISHFFDPETLLASVQALYGHHPSASHITMICSDFEYNEQLSPQVVSALPCLIAKIEESLVLDSTFTLC